MKNQRIFNWIVVRFAAMLIIMLSFKNAYSQVAKEWETGSVFLTPESIVFDPLNNCLYVSNFNDKGGFRNKEDKLFDECISKLNIQGEILEFSWIDSLLGPTGLAIYNNKLYIVERDGISIANIDKREIERKILIEGAGFPNDIVIDKNGIAYISDSNNNCIYKIQNGKSEIWYSDSIMNTSNGLFIDNENLLVGNRGDANLISISLTDKTVKIVARDVSDNIDGIKKVNNNYLLSWRSELYTLDSDNKKTILFKSDDEKEFLADFEFIEKENLLIIPTLLTNKVIAFKIDK